MRVDSMPARSRKALTLVFAAVSLIVGPELGAQESEAPEPAAEEVKDQGLDERIEALEKRISQQDDRIKELEAREQEAPASELDAAAEDSPYRLGLFFIETRDGKNKLRIGLTLTAHGTFSSSDDFINTFEMRYLRPFLQGQLFGWIEYQVDMEFGRTDDADARNAFVNLHAIDELQLKLGQFLYPFSINRLRPIPFLKHPERPVSVFDIVGPFQTGAMLHSELFEKRLRGYLGIFNGNGANRIRDEDDGKDVAARIEYEPIEGLTFAASAIYTPTDRDKVGPSDVSTVGDQISRFLDYDTLNNRLLGPRIRYSAELQWSRGPFELTAELLAERYEDLRRGPAGAETDLDTTAFYIDLSYLLTGEKNQWVVEPKSPLYDDGKLGTGALELALRIEYYQVERDVLSRGFAVGTDKILAETVTFNWYFAKGVLLGLSYTHTEYDDTVVTSRGRSEHGDNSGILRFTVFF